MVFFINLQHLLHVIFIHQNKSGVCGTGCQDDVRFTSTCRSAKLIYLEIHYQYLCQRECKDIHPTLRLNFADNVMSSVQEFANLCKKHAINIV